MYSNQYIFEIPEINAIIMDYVNSITISQQDILLTMIDNLITYIEPFIKS